MKILKKIIKKLYSILSTNLSFFRKLLKSYFLGFNKSLIRKTLKDIYLYQSPLQKEGGILKIKNFLSIEENTKLKKIMEDVLLKNFNQYEILNGFSLTIKQAINKVKPKLSNNGKVRISFKSINDLKEFIDQNLYNSLISNLKNNLNINWDEWIIHRAVFEHISPNSLNHIDWHIDTNIPELKLMILLEDVGISNGPMKFSKFSGDLSTNYDIRKKLFLKGVINKANLTKSPNEWFTCTGEQRDGLFFDTRYHHSGSNVINGRRINLVFSLKFKPIKNQKLLNNYLSLAFDN